MAEVKHPAPVPETARPLTPKTRAPKRPTHTGTEPLGGNKPLA